MFINIESINFNIKFLKFHYFLGGNEPCQKVGHLKLLGDTFLQRLLKNLDRFTNKNIYQTI